MKLGKKDGLEKVMSFFSLLLAHPMIIYITIMISPKPIFLNHGCAASIVNKCLLNAHTVMQMGSS